MIKNKLIKILALGVTGASLFGGTMMANTDTVEASSNVYLMFNRNSYKYNKNGKQIGKSSIRKESSYLLKGTRTIHGKKYYRIGNGTYVRASSVTPIDEDDFTQYTFDDLYHDDSEDNGPKPPTTKALSGFNKYDLFLVIEEDMAETNGNFRPLRTTRTGVSTDWDYEKLTCEKSDESDLPYGDYEVEIGATMTGLKPAPYTRDLKEIVCSYSDLYDFNTNNRKKNLPYVYGVLADFNLPANATKKKLRMKFTVRLMPEGYQIISHENVK